jgi:hypothetical protein
MFRVVTKFGIQRIIALLLLATFVPVAVLSEAGHLIPGVGGSCGCFKFVGECSHEPNSICLHDFYSHDHEEHIDCVVDRNGNNESVDIAGLNGFKITSCVEQHCDCRCVVHEFCMLFNSFGITVFIFPIFGEIAAELGVLNFLLVFCGFFSLFQARAPPSV